MPVTTGNPDEVLLGAGTLYAAPIGTTEPSDASSALPSAWREIGWTEDGSTLNYEITTADVEVEEEFDPVKVVTTKRVGEVAFQMAQVTRANLALALNKGASGQTGTGILEPPDPGDEVRVMLVLDTEDGARYLFRRCVQSGRISINRKKAPDKATIPVTFKLEKPASDAPFGVFPSSGSTV